MENTTPEFQRGENSITFTFSSSFQNTVAVIDADSAIHSLDHTESKILLFLHAAQQI